VGLILNAIIQTIVWYGFMAAIIFAAAGTIAYPVGWHQRESTRDKSEGLPDQSRRHSCFSRWLASS
jgi:hypothetical protein